MKDKYEGDNMVSPALLWDMIELKVREIAVLRGKQKEKL